MSASAFPTDPKDAYREGWKDKEELQRIAARSSYPALYALLYPWIKEIAREHGYAVGLHGSMARDLDLIAVPWTEEAADPEVLVKAIADRLGAFLDGRALLKGKAAGKPHGRLGWILNLVGGEAYIDLSVFAPAQPNSDSAPGEQP